MSKRMKSGFMAVVAVLVFAGAAFAADVTWRTAFSSDGVPIAYGVSGKGDTALVFVHGWSCDSRYWQEQVPHFARKYRVVTVDLAGHGNSGLGREVYSMDAFGEDVKAVAGELDAERLILVGHSMAGIVIAEAARKMPGRVVGIIGVDTLNNVEKTVPQEQVDGFAAAFEKDFRAAAAPFVRSMFVKDTPPAVAEWIVDDMGSAPPAVAVSSFREMMGMYVRGEVAPLFDGLSVPVRCVNADLWPTDSAANRRHMKSFDLRVIEGRGHFAMLEDPRTFNRELEKAVRGLLAGR